jgi:hypothetical protein
MKPARAATVCDRWILGLLVAAAGCGEASRLPAPGEGRFPEGHRRMLDSLKAIAERSADEHPYQGSRVARELSRDLETLPAGAPDLERWRLNRLLGVAEMKLGKEREGIEHLTAAYGLLAKVRGEVGEAMSVETIFRLGVGYMRLGETQNCCVHPTAESCILPIRKGGLHSAPEGSRTAIRYFEEVLRSSGAGEEDRLKALWLLNVAYMTLGEYPEKVPSRFLIPPQSFAPEADFPRFQNIASDLGLDTFSLSGGVVAEDFDGDGYIDLLVSTWDTSGAPRLFRNNADGTFSDRSQDAGLEGLYGGLNMVQADYDNDGDADVLVLRGAWAAEAGQHPNSLLQNDGRGRFTDVTFEAGLGEVHYPTQTAAWSDYDDDGDLDLYVGNESTAKFTAPCQLFENQGAGRFVDVAERAGVTNLRFAKGVTWGDYNADRYPDLYVSNYLGANRLYHNNQNGTFTDLAPALGLVGPKDSFPVWFWDFDNDGALDLFVSAYTGRAPHVAAHCLGLPSQYEPASLYRGDGTGRFRDVAADRGLVVPMLPMGSNYGDLDGDGFLDFYLGTGDPDFASLVPNLLFMNQAGERFVNRTMAAGVGHLQKGHAVAFADFDLDGDLDIFEQMGGAMPGDRFADAFYENPGFGNRWLAVDLAGRTSNRSAIGARIRVDVEDGGMKRSIYRHVTSGGSFGANPLRQFFGLGKAASISRLEVFWPTTGRSQSFAELPADQTIRIVEGEERVTPLNLRHFQFRKRERS